MTACWAVIEGGTVHHVFEDEDEALEYAQAAAQMEGQGVTVTNAEYNQKEEAPPEVID